MRICPIILGFHTSTRTCRSHLPSATHRLAQRGQTLCLFYFLPVTTAASPAIAERKQSSSSQLTGALVSWLGVSCSLHRHSRVNLNPPRPIYRRKRAPFHSKAPTPLPLTRRPQQQLREKGGSNALVPHATRCLNCARLLVRPSVDLTLFLFAWAGFFVILFPSSHVFLPSLLLPPLRSPLPWGARLAPRIDFIPNLAPPPPLQPPPPAALQFFA
jgi:hypothetical protein